MNPYLKIGALTVGRHEVPEEWSDYFKKVGKYRGCLFTDLKQIIALKLFENGMTYEKIVQFLHLKNHSSAQHLVKKRKKTTDYDLVKKFHVMWINEGVYPFTITTTSGHTNTNEGFNNLFKLVKI
jgi:hypothetical protein